MAGPSLRSVRRPAGHRLIVLLAVALLAAPMPAEAAVDTSPPSRPGPVTVQSVAQRGAVVDFGRSTDRGGTVTYRVLANGTSVARSRHPHDVAIPLECGTTYFVTAVAVDKAGNRSLAAPGANLRTRACLDTTAPGAPAGLAATRVRDDRVRLTWEPARDPGNGPVPNYLVYRDGVVLGGSTTRGYTARNLRPSTAYLFTVKARDRSGNLSRASRLTVTTLPPEQATGDVRAFLLGTDGNSFADAQRHYRQLDRVFPTYFSLTAKGDVTGTGQPSVTSWLQVRGVKVMPRFHSEDVAVIEAVVTNADVRAHAVDAVTRVVRAGGYDGASLDLEMNMPTTGVNGLTVEQRWDRLREGYSLFVEAVAERLHADSRLLSVAVSPNWCNTVDRATRQTIYCSDSSSTSTRRPRAYLFDYERLAAVADELWVMAWGLHWSTSDPGPMADMRWLRAVRDYYTDLFADQPYLASHVTLGTNLYGMDWSFRVVRTDQVLMPGGTVPAAPACTSTTKTARARYSYSGTPQDGTLTVEWVCLTRYAATAEYGAVLAQQDHFSTVRFDEESGENVLAGNDEDQPGASREIWYPDARSIGGRVSLAARAGMHPGFWRLGDEDPEIWDADPLTTGIVP